MGAKRWQVDLLLTHGDSGYSVRSYDVEAEKVQFSHGLAVFTNESDQIIASFASVIAVLEHQKLKPNTAQEKSLRDLLMALDDYLYPDRQAKRLIDRFKSELTRAIAGEF